MGTRMSKVGSPVSDVMRVYVRDLDDRLVRILDLWISPEVVLQGSRWMPGLIVPHGEDDLEAMEICGIINEGGFALDEDGVPLNAEGELLGANEQVVARWTAKRESKGFSYP